MPTLHCYGRFGNQLFQYCRAKALCALSGTTLYVSPWLGQKVFDLADPPADPHAPNDFPGIAQRQVDLVYTRTQLCKWLRWRSDVEAALVTNLPAQELPHAHLRRGDYLINGYVVVSESSYTTFCERRGYEPPVWVSEEHPLLIDSLPPWLPDFWRLGHAPILLRANSTFSWWAHVLGRDDQMVFSPIIDNQPPGPEPSFCEFIPGNHPRMSQCCLCTDLILCP